MKIDIPQVLGATDVSIDLYCFTIADGVPFALNHDTAGLELWYRREGAVEVDMTSSIQALAGLDAAHADGGVEPYIEIPGLARVDVVDATCAASGSPKYVIVGGILAGKEIVPVKIPLTAGNPYTAVGQSVDHAAAIADLPTNAELSTALGTADDAVLSALTTIATAIDTIDDLLDTEVAALTSDLAKVPKSDGVVSLNATVLAAIADAMLNRDMATGTDSGSTTVRTVRQALRALRNKVSESGGTVTITKEDDATASWTTAITGTPAVTASDPAGP